MVYSKGQSIEIQTNGQTYYAIVDMDNIEEVEITKLFQQEKAIPIIQTVNGGYSPEWIEANRLSNYM